MEIQAAILRTTYVTANQAAALLGVHYLTVHEYIRRGKLPSILVAHRRWIPKVAIAEHYHDLLSNPETRAATIERLQAIAVAAGVALDVEEMLAGVVTGPRGGSGAESVIGAVDKGELRQA